MPGLRKNLNQSKPSMGASFHAPPTAENQPPALPAAASASHCAGADCGRGTSHTAAASASATPATAAPIACTTSMPRTTRPNTANCIGIVYLDWSCSRRNVL